MGTKRATDVDEEEYRERWNSHIDDLSSLGWHLTEKERDDLETIQENLKTLVKRAASRRGDDD